MIVRDESAVLERFLDSTKGLWDQFVAVDTGSRDNTINLLRNGGAEVVEMSWQDNFALARNESLRHARTDWILVLDADEFPQPGFGDELRALLTRDNVGAANISRHDLQRNGGIRHSKTLRLFRRSAEIQYRFRIHETATESVVAMLEREKQTLGELKTPVIHIGYTPDRLALTKKKDRDERLLRLAIAEDENDLYSRYKLLEQLRFWGDTPAGLNVAKECLTLIRDKGIKVHPAHIAGDLVDMINATLFPSEPHESLAFLSSMEPIAGHTARYRLALGMLHEQQERLGNAFKQYSKALELSASDMEQMLIETRTLCGLARLSLMISDLASAQELVSAAKKLLPEDEEVAALSRLLSISSQIS